MRGRTTLDQVEGGLYEEALPTAAEFRPHPFWCLCRFLGTVLGGSGKRSLPMVLWHSREAIGKPFGLAAATRPKATPDVIPAKAGIQPPIG